MIIKKDFNTIPMTRFAATIAKVSGANKPDSADENVINEVLNLVEEKTGGTAVEKVVIYNPDAIGEYYVDSRPKIFAPLIGSADLCVNLLTAFPPKTPVCFGTMFTGVNPEVHGIQHYEKKLITVSSLFDKWAEAGKKVALISKEKQSIPTIFANRNIDYYLLKNDDEVLIKALELIESDKYDVIEVYNQEYDDKLHVSSPDSPFCRRAARNYVRNYISLKKKIKDCYASYNTLLTFSPDHGSHRIGGFLLGTHGKNTPRDMNVKHFFEVIPRRND